MELEANVSQESTPAYTSRDMMIVAAARQCHDGEKVLVGVGLPMIAALLAKRTHAPRLVITFESGILDSRPDRLPVAIGDPSLVKGSAAVVSLMEMFGKYLGAGLIDVGFLGTAQVDRYGNLNTTVIGPYHAPKVRLPGSGGHSDIASLARRTVVILPHERRNFPERVDFVTSPGYLTGGRAREEAGLRWGGPDAVITSKAVLGFDPESREMELRSYHPGSTVEEIKADMQWPLKVAEDVRETMPPSAEELAILRGELRPDPRMFKRAQG